MIPVKIQCGCGQKYAFEVEPVNDRMPFPIACPVCNTDGTTAANQVIAQMFTSQPPAPIAAAPRTFAAPPSPGAPPPPAPIRPAPQDAMRRIVHSSAGVGGKADNWKWWYYVLAGICIGGYSIWQAYDRQSIKPLGELFLAAFAIAIGIWDFQRKRKEKREAQG